jgi:hypothetical protein
MENDDEISEGYESSFDGGAMSGASQGQAQSPGEFGTPTCLQDIMDSYWRGVDDAFEQMNVNMTRHEEMRSSLFRKLTLANSQIDLKQNDANLRKEGLMEQLRELESKLNKVLHAIQDVTMRTNGYTNGSDDGEKDDEEV